MRGKIRVYAASGHNVTTAVEMKEALDSGSGVVGESCIKSSQFLSQKYFALLKLYTLILWFDTCVM